METFTIAQTARHLGVSDTATRKMIGRSELAVLGVDPLRLDPQHVDQVRRMRQQDILHNLARRGQTPVGLAREARRVLFPRQPTTGIPDREAAGARLRLSLIQPETRQLFGVAAITAACSGGDSCRWCRAADFARVLGGWAPEQYSEGFAALLDQEPCERCGPALYKPLMASLAARVHGGAKRLPEAAVVPSAAERERAREYVSRRPVTAAAAPAGDGGGRGLVARRRREVTARLKDARRRGDTRHAFALQKQLQALVADAARVDGRVPSATDRPGTLRCGHQLAAGCSCPRRASKRSAS